MIYGQDDPMLFPVADLYDSGMMNMYINAAREQYNQNREDMKDFMKTYGDFISPISADMDWVDQQTRGRINDALNYLQQNGIDPLRSAEGRAIIQRVIRDTPTAGINARRQSAENAREYLKNKAALERQGLYNPNFESYRLDGKTINNWNTGNNGIWQETSPLEYKDLNEYTGHIFDKMEDEFISSDGIYDYTGVSRERRNQALTQQIGGLLGTPLGRFHYENSRANAAAILGREPTEEEVLNQFKDDILTATVEYERRNRKENPEYARQREFYYGDKLDAAKTARDIDAYRQKAAIDAAYDPNNYGPSSSSSSSSSGSGSGNNTNAVMSMGAADQLSLDQLFLAANNQLNFERMFNTAARQSYNRQVELYNKLNPDDKKIAELYGKSYRILQDPKSTKSQKDTAAINLSRFNNKKDPNFIAWRDQFNDRMSKYNISAGQAWVNANTTEGLANYKPQTPEQLVQRSREIFNKTNLITSFTAKQKQDVNTILDYSIDEDSGDEYGKMHKDRDLTAVTLAKMTGSRAFRHNDIANVVSRAIRGKTYTVENNNTVRREYGSGNINKKRYNVINEIATFTDPDVSNALNKYSEEQLAVYGIKKKDKNTYEIPITTKFGHGQGWADINTTTMQRTQGVANVAKYNSTIQAKEVQASAEGQ